MECLKRVSHIFSLIGSVLWLLVHHILPADPETNLAQIWKDVQVLYEELRVENRYGQMRMTMFTSSSQPKMKGKAAEIKDLGPVVVRLWLKYYNKRVEVHRQILAVLEASAHLDEILTDHPTDFVLPDAAAEDLISTGFIMCSIQYAVFQHFKALDMPLFGLTAKAYLLLRCCLLSKLGGPVFLEIDGATGAYVCNGL